MTDLLPMVDRPESLPSISLYEIDATTALQRRVDRKYIVVSSRLDSAGRVGSVS